MAVKKRDIKALYSVRNVAQLAFNGRDYPCLARKFILFTNSLRALCLQCLRHIAFACLQANKHSPVVRKQFTGLFSFLQPTSIRNHLVKVAFLFLYLHFLPYNKHGKTKQQINYLLFKILFFNGKWNRAAGKSCRFFRYLIRR